MKKVFALALALAMVLSLASVAFAENSELKDDDGDVCSLIDVKKDQLFKYESDNPAGERMETTNSIAFAQTRYFLLTLGELDDYEGNEENPKTMEVGGIEYVCVTDSKTVSGLKVTPKWTDGGEYVKSVEIVKKDGAYYVALTTTGSELDGVDLAGKIYLKGTSGTGDYKEKIDHYFDVDLTIEYGKGNVDNDAKKLYVYDSKKVYDLEDVDNDDYTIYFVPEADVEIQSSKNAVACVEVDVTNEEDVLLFYKVDDVESVVDAYPDANLDFVALTGAFKKTAEVTVYADEGTYLYKVVDGKVVAMDAEYDEWEEGFVFKTKTLGTYVISDVELEVGSAVTDVTETPEEGTTNNPTTGAAA